MYGHPRSQLGTAGIGMPRPLQDDLRQESQESRTANTLTSRFAPVGEEARGTNRLSRTSSAASLPESSGNDSSFENLENQINALIKPLQDQITALTKQSSKLLEENLRSHKLLVEQGELIYKLTKNNEILEFRLAEQQSSFDQQLSQERQAREATAKSMEEFKPQIFSKLKQHQEKLHEELVQQTSKINANNEALHLDFNSLKSQTTKAEQRRNQELQETQQNLLMFSIKPQVSQFFKHVGYGVQEETEQMLKQNPKLAIARGDLTDCSKRTWQEITAFQYAVLALDYHMWTMLLKYLPEDKAKEQLEDLNTKATLEENGWVIKPEMEAKWPIIALGKLVEALDVYVKNYGSWNYCQRQDHWCGQIGGAQLIAPAHIINEYSHPNRPNGFVGSKWGDNEDVLPRVGVNNSWYLAGDNKKLGFDIAWARLNGADRGICGKTFGLHCHFITYDRVVRNIAAMDYPAMKSLLTVRVRQAKTLISKLISNDLNCPVVQLDPEIKCKNSYLI